MVHLKLKKGKRTEQRPSSDFIIQMKWGERREIPSVPEDRPPFGAGGAAWRQ